MSTLDEEVLGILRKSTNGQNTRYTIARILEGRRSTKPGAMHLAVNRAMFRLQAAGKITVIPPEDQHGSHTMALSKR